MGVAERIYGESVRAVEAMQIHSVSLNMASGRRLTPFILATLPFLMDTLDSKARSRLMSRIKGTRTGPELTLRRALWAQGYRYRLKSKLPGKPDLVFGRAKVAVFVDGCFWHGCPIHGHVPKSNQDYWPGKLARTVARDQANNVALAELGWVPLRIWEHELREDIAGCVSRVAEAVRRCTAGPRRA